MKTSGRKGQSRPNQSNGVVWQIISRVQRAFLPDVQTFPNVYRSKLKYAWTSAMSTAAGSATTQTFRLTSLYDPDFTGAGSQPRFFDTLCAASGGTAPYSQYRVVRTHYKVMWMNPSTTSSTGAIAFCQVFYQNQLSSSCTLDDYYTAVNCRSALVAQAGNDNGVVAIEGSVDHAKFLGNKDVLDVDDLLAAYNANPAINDFLTVGIRAVDDTTVAAYRVIVQLCFEVEFVSLNEAGDS